MTGVSLGYNEGGGWLLCQGTPFAQIMVGPEPYGFVDACAE